MYFAIKIAVILTKWIHNQATENVKMGGTEMWKSSTSKLSHRKCDRFSIRECIIVHFKYANDKEKMQFNTCMCASASVTMRCRYYKISYFNELFISFNMFFSILLAFLPIPTTLSISYLYSFHWCKRFLFDFFDEFNDKITLIAIKTLKKEKLKEKRDFHDDNIHRLWKLETFVSQQLLNSLLTVYI